MSQLIATIQTALPVFLALALGMLCRQRSFLSRDGVDTLKKVVINITLPAVLLQAFASATYTLRTINGTGGNLVLGANEVPVLGEIGVSV